MANKAQLIVSSSQTYYNNTAGNITPDSVNAFNTTWINSSVLNENSASFMVTASAQASTITFTNGDGSTYLVQIAQSGSSVSASYAVFADTSRSSSLATTASFALRGQGAFTGSFSGSVSASFSGSGVGIFGIVSSSYAVTASQAINASTASFLLGTVASASYAINADLLDGIDSTGYAKTGSNTFKAPNTFEDGVVLNNITAQAAGADGGNINITPFTASKVVLHNNQVTSGSITIKDQLTGNEVVLSSDNTANTLAVNGNIQANSPYSFIGNATQLTAVTASLVGTLNQTVTISGSLSVSNTTTLANVTASNVKITGTASIAFLDVTFQSSSIIYSSGSNQFGDASNDTQTLWGTVDVISGPLVVTGSANFKETITGSITSAISASNSTLLSGMPSSSFATTGSNLFKGNQTITGSNFLQQGGVFSIYNNDGTTAFALSTPAQLAAINVPFAATSGITGNLTGTASFATTASYANTSLTSSFFDGDTLITKNIEGGAGGNLNITSTGLNGIKLSTSNNYPIILSGSTQITGSLSAQAISSSFSGSGAQIFGVVSASYAYTASSAVNAASSISASYANNFLISGSQIITGSLYGSPISQSVSSLTASLNLARGNFFNLTLPASANTYITASGQLPGQTINLKITQGATSGSVSLGAGIKQVSGSSYTVTAAANTTDILTFIAFDNTGLYVSSVKNLI